MLGCNPIGGLRSALSARSEAGSSQVGRCTRVSQVRCTLSLGVVGAMLLPVLAAVGAISALVADCTIVLEKVEE